MNIKVIIDDLYKNREVRIYTDYAPSLRAERQGLLVMESCKEFGKLVSEKYSRMHDVSRRIYDAEGISPTIHTMQGGGNTELKIAIEESKPFIVASRGRNPENPSDRTAGIKTEQRLEPKWVSEKGVNYICDPKRGMCTDINADTAQTITAKGQSNWTGSFVSPDIDYLEKPTTIGSTEPTKIHLKNGEYVTSNDNLANYRIRKLTPNECWRLMGFSDEDFSKAQEVNSNTQLYKQAGNSIVVNTLMAIFWELLL